MSRIVSLGAARQEIYLIDRDDFEGLEIEDQSIFGKMIIGTHVDIDKTFFGVGGSGANAAVTFARHGHETIFIGNLAHDAAGESVLECFDSENIDSSYANFVRMATGCSVILLDAKSGDRTVLNYRGASAKTDNLSAADLVTIQPDWLYASTLYGDMEKLLEFFEKAHALGAKVMFNPGPAELKQSKKLIGLLDDVDVLLVNKKEAAQIVPGVLLTELLAHLANYCETVLITDGSMGAIATNHEATFRLGVYEQTRVRDATGVGDAFGSGFLAEFAASGDFERSLKFASANAAKVTQKYGAETGILTGDENFHLMPIQKVEDPAGFKKN